MKVNTMRYIILTATVSSGSCSYLFPFLVQLLCPLHDQLSLLLGFYYLSYRWRCWSCVPQPSLPLYCRRTLCLETCISVVVDEKITFIPGSCSCSKSLYCCCSFICTQRLGLPSIEPELKILATLLYFLWFCTLQITCQLGVG